MSTLLKMYDYILNKRNDPIGVVVNLRAFVNLHIQVFLCLFCPHARFLGIFCNLEDNIFCRAESF